MPGSDRNDHVDVRPATEDDLPAVMNVLDAALLDVDAADVRGRIAGSHDGGGVIVALAGERVLGACVVDPSTGDGGHVEAIAIRRGRRGQGIGSALIEAAVERWGPLAADFDEDVRPFYESLGFEITTLGGGRCRGVRRA
jgi:ribosomal protein S18 acetylase RimI-like enzyme